MNITNRQLILLAGAVEHMAHSSEQDIDALIEFFEKASEDIKFDDDQGDGLHYAADEAVARLLESLYRDKHFIEEEREEQRIRDEEEFVLEEEGEEDDA